MQTPDALLTHVGEEARTVLHMEGTLANLDLVEAIVARLPLVRVLPVLQGRRGLELARSLQPALILVDLALPDIPGMTVLCELRDHYLTRHIPVITLGPATTAPLTAHLEEVGARAHFTLPLDVGRFFSLLKGLLT